MGRLGNATQHHQGLEFQEIHQSPAADTIDDAPPPPPEEDLYEPPPEYQPPPPPATKPPPPPHPFPPTQDNGYDKPPQPFPPQQHTAEPFPPQQTDHKPPKPFPPGQAPPQPALQRPPMVQPFPSPLLMPQQNLLLPQPWKSHLFDCMKNPQNAIITLFFPCVTFGQIAEILDNGSTSCATSGILYSFIACCIGMPCLMSCGYRSKLRARHGLLESPAPDCLIHCFCEYCALCQEYRELQDRGFDPSIGYAGNVAKQQQRLQQFGMTPPMQQTMM